MLGLVPSGVVTVLAMLWATWAGRPRRDEADRRDDAAYERFARAITKEHPAAHRPAPAAVRDRSTGIAVRPSRGAGSAGTPRSTETRRSA